MNMKKYLYIIASATLALLAASCAKEQGTVPGNDSAPVVSAYSYTPSGDYNPDNDVQVRFAANNAVADVYYMVEDTATVNTFIAAQGEDAYAKKIVSEGTKVADAGGKVTDVVLTGIAGSYFISVVGTGKNGANTEMKQIFFKGLKWVDLAKGTYQINAAQAARFGQPAVTATLQKCENDEGHWRVKDAFGAGYDLTMWEYGDPENDIQHFTIPGTATPFTFSSYGTVFVRDVSTWQNDPSYAAYNSVNLKTFAGSFWVQYYVSAGNLGYDDDLFIPSA